MSNAILLSRLLKDQSRTPTPYELRKIAEELERLNAQVETLTKQLEVNERWRKELAYYIEHGFHPANPAYYA